MSTSVTGVAAIIIGVSVFCVMHLFPVSINSNSPHDKRMVNINAIPSLTPGNYPNANITINEFNVITTVTSSSNDLGYAVVRASNCAQDDTPAIKTAINQVINSGLNG